MPNHAVTLICLVFPHRSLLISISCNRPNEAIADSLLQNWSTNTHYPTLFLDVHALVRVLQPTFSLKSPHWLTPTQSCSLHLIWQVPHRSILICISRHRPNETTADSPLQNWSTNTHYLASFLYVHALVRVLQPAFNLMSLHRLTPTRSSVNLDPQSIWHHPLSVWHQSDRSTCRIAEQIQSASQP